MTHRAPLTLLTAAALLALAACERATPDEQPATDPAPAAPQVTTTAGEPNRAPGLDPPAAAGDDAIPAAMQGRWGLVPADCEPGRADAKGLLIVAPRRLEFYESAATLTDINEAAPGNVRAAFAFTGEGMSWQRDMTLAVEQGGEVLVRREFGEDAATEPFRYTKC